MNFPIIQGGDDRCGVVLVGNSKVGKSTLFSRLCPGRPNEETIKNLKRKIEFGYAGKTRTRIYNTPGILSVFSKNLEQRVARDILIPGAMVDKVGRIVIVADAKNLKRSIVLALQFAEYDLPMLFVLNMVDEAEKKGIWINTGKLSSLLGMPVCKTVARDGKGIDELIACLQMMQRPSGLVSHSDEIDDFMDEAKSLLASCDMSVKALSLLVLTSDPGIRRYLRKTCGHETVQQIHTLAESVGNRFPESPALRFLKTYTKKAEEIVRLVQTTEGPDHRKISARLGQMCMAPMTGIPIAVLV